MLLDLTVHVILKVAAGYKSILGTPVHRLGVNVVVLLVVLLEPAALLPLLEILHSLIVGLLGMLIGYRVKIDLRLNDVQQRLLASLCLGLLGVQHIVGA